MKSSFLLKKITLNDIFDNFKLYECFISGPVQDPLIFGLPDPVLFSSDPDPTY